jgi:hypothetical protein
MRAVFTNTFPIFEKGRILKTEMLENLRDFPREFADIFFQNFSDGVISGAELAVGKNTITITRGMIKHRNKLYMLHEDHSIAYSHTNKEMVLKVRFAPEAAASDFCRNQSLIVLDENPVVAGAELELGRFKLQEGAQLRSDYTDFYDFSTEFNTINIIHLPYAGRRASTMKPVVMKYFAKVLLANRAGNHLDISFAMQCLNHERVERELIVLYLAGRLGIPCRQYSNWEIYKHLAQIVRETDGGKQSNGSEPRQPPNRPGRIMVD